MLKVKVIHRISCAAPRCKLGGDQRYPVSFQDPPCSSAPQGTGESGVFPSSTLGSTLGSIPRSSCRPRGGSGRWYLREARPGAAAERGLRKNDDVRFGDREVLGGFSDPTCLKGNEYFMCTALSEPRAGRDSLLPSSLLPLH